MPLLVSSTRFGRSSALGSIVAQGLGMIRIFYLSHFLSSARSVLSILPLFLWYATAHAVTWCGHACLVPKKLTDFRSTAEARAHRDYPTPPLTTAACCGGEVSLGELRVVGVVVVVVVVCAAVQVGWRGVPRRNWPGGGSGTDPSGGIASPARGRTRPVVSLRMGR